MNACVVTVGAEILSGDIHDTNFRDIAGVLRDAGLQVRLHESVPDTVPAISAVVRRALDDSQGYGLILLTGGLGPTPDDLTREGVAEALGVDLVRQETLATELKRRFEEAGYGPIPENNYRQIALPRGSQGLPNPLGSAPGFAVRSGSTWVVAVPGVPHEMRLMVREQVLPLVTRDENLMAPTIRRIRVQGVGESSLAERIDGLLDDLAVEVGFYPRNPGVDIKLMTTGPGETAGKILDQAEHRLRDRLRPAVFAVGRKTLSARVGELLVERNLTLALAESCTGGAVAAMLIRTPGASRYVDRGVVAYSNRAKEALLGVPGALIDVHGAVSPEVAEAMAAGLRGAAGTDLALSTTGIAGPDGGSEDKPVGLAYVAIAGPKGMRSWKHRAHGNRATVIRRTAVGALNRLRLVLEGEEKGIL